MSNKVIKQETKKNDPAKSLKAKIGSLVLTALAAVAFVAVIYYANLDRPVYHSSDTTGIEYEVGLVKQIINDNTTVDKTDKNILRGSMDLKIEIISGRYKGDIVNVTNLFSSLYNIKVKQGDKVSIRIDTSGKNKYQVSIYNYYRVPQLVICVMVFVVMLMLIGGKKGAKSVFALVFTLVCIIWILLPLTLKGYPALPITIAIVLVSNIVTFFLIDGISVKSVVAAAGSLSGVLAGAAFSIIFQTMMSVTTYQTDEAETLMLIMGSTNLHMKDLLLCGILIACTGAVMDVSMSITSSIAELKSVNPSMKAKELFMSGMNIGRDAMGTMSNTLILAFAGNSLNMMLMIYSYGVSFQQLMNTNFVAVEIIRGIAGSVGIICTVPLVAFIAANVYASGGKR